MSKPGTEMSMRTIIIAAATATAVFVAGDYAMAGSFSPSRPAVGGTSDNFPWANTPPPSDLASPSCGEVLAAPRRHTKEEVTYCRAARHS
jgi:hypothetical protein